MKKLNPKYVAGWGIIGLAALALEITALVDDGRGDTASELTWAILGVHPLVWFVAASLFGWVAVHFFQRTWRKP